MSIIRCDSCDRLIDTDIEPEGYYDADGHPWANGDYICMLCQEAKEQADYLAELNRGYEQDRI